MFLLVNCLSYFRQGSPLDGKMLCVFTEPFCFSFTFFLPIEKMTCWSFRTGKHFRRGQVSLGRPRHTFDSSRSTWRMRKWVEITVPRCS